MDPQSVTAAAHAIAVAAMQQLSAPLADATKLAPPTESVGLGGESIVPLPAAPAPNAAAAAATAAAALGQLAAALASQTPQVVQAPAGIVSSIAMLGNLMCTTVPDQLGMCISC